jgi:hypothetical protein
VTDSSCDLPRQLLERFRIAVAPLIVRFGSEVYEDGELSLDEPRSIGGHAGMDALHDRAGHAGEPAARRAGR